MIENPDKTGQMCLFADVFMVLEVFVGGWVGPKYNTGSHGYMLHQIDFYQASETPTFLMQNFEILDDIRIDQTLQCGPMSSQNTFF